MVILNENKIAFPSCSNFNIAMLTIKVKEHFYGQSIYIATIETMHISLKPVAVCDRIQ